MLKIYVIDTNILLTDPSSIYSFNDGEIIIPFVVLEELDKKKVGLEEVNRNARLIIRTLDSFREFGNLTDGVTVPVKGKESIKVRVETQTNNHLPEEKSNDNKIINTALNLKQKNLFTHDIILVSNDINVRVKCDSLGLKTRGIADIKDEQYTGFAELIVDSGSIDMMYSGEPLYLDDMGLMPNQYVLLRAEYNLKHSGMVRFVNEGEPVEKVIIHKDVWGVAPKNMQQVFTFDSLLNSDIELVMLQGQAGCGKTLCAFAAGLEQVVNKKLYKKVVIMRPVMSLSKETALGFLPGDLDEKLAEWMQPIMDQLSILQGSKSVNYFTQLIEDGFVEFGSIGHVRGRSLSNAFIIVDEAQNLSKHEIKTLITRVGKNSKMVLTGDIGQIDSLALNKINNGLSHAVNCFKPYAIASNVMMLKGERSGLASLAAEIL